MLRYPLLALLILCGGISTLSAADSVTKKWEVSIEDNDDWAPGEGGGMGSGGGELPPCDYIGEADIRDCEISPSTPVDPPAVAPDNCYYYDWTYDADVYLVWGCG